MAELGGCILGSTTCQRENENEATTTNSSIRLPTHVNRPEKASKLIVALQDYIKI